MRSPRKSCSNGPELVADLQPGDLIGTRPWRGPTSGERSRRGVGSAVHPLHVGNHRTTQRCGARQRRTCGGVALVDLGGIRHRSRDVFWAASDVGWVVGHSYIVRPLLAGAATVLYEGKPVGTLTPAPSGGSSPNTASTRCSLRRLLSAPSARRIPRAVAHEPRPVVPAGPVPRR